MIYQHVNKRTKILPIATPTQPIYATSLIMFALPISMPRFKSINFYHNIPKTKLFFAKFVCVLGAGLRLQASKTPTPIANFWLRAWCFDCCYVVLCKLILQLAGVYGFPEAALSLNKFAHPVIDHSLNN